MTAARTLLALVALLAGAAGYAQSVPTDARSGADPRLRDLLIEVIASLDSFEDRFAEVCPDVEILETQHRETVEALRGISEERAGFRYAPEKWSIREVVGHLLDTERVMAYRALRIARGDTTPLAGFEENSYVEAAGFDARPLPDLVAEFGLVRTATLALLRGFDEVAFQRRGTASGWPVSVRALAFIIAGHERHHAGLLRERYGLG